MNHGLNGANNNTGYLTDEELEKLIARTEAGEMLHPPKEFQHEIIGRIRQKRQQSKNRQLFSYGMKVFAVTAAMLCILFIIPGDGYPEDRFRNRQSIQNGSSLSAETERFETEGFAGQLNRKMNEYCSKLDERLNQLVRMEVLFHEKEEK